MAVPALRSLRRGFPQAEIWVAAKAGTGGLFAVDGLADGTVELPEDSDVRGLRLAARKIRERSFDAGLLLTNSFGSALLFYLGGVRERWGYAADGRSLLLTKPVPRPKTAGPRHHVHYYLDLVAGLGLKTLPPDLKISLPPADRQAARARLDSLGVDPVRPLVALCPGAGYGPAKRWPADRFAAAAALIQERRGTEVLIIGSAAEAGIAEAIRKEMDRPPRLLTGSTSLRELMSVIALSTLVISNDTGPMHLAGALGVPVVGIFGPTDPAVTGPFAPAVARGKERGALLAMLLPQVSARPPLPDAHHARRSRRGRRVHLAMTTRAVFLDRDGTLNEDAGYPGNFGSITIFPVSFEAVRRLNEAGLLAIVVSNQSGVGRGFFGEAEVADIHAQMAAAFAAAGARIDAFYFCPHFEGAAEPRYAAACDCRKPKPGLALRAAADFGIDLGRSYMIGDKPDDIAFGRNIGAAPVLVLTGRGGTRGGGCAPAGRNRPTSPPTS